MLDRSQIAHMLMVAKNKREELHNTVHIGFPEFEALCETAVALKVAVRGPRADGRYDLYLGDEYLGHYDQQTVTPLANAIGLAIGEYPR